LTDPIRAETSGSFGIGPRRVAAPGIRFEDLPRIDLVVVSHDHYDDMDFATLKRLWDRDKPLILTSLGNDKMIAGGGAKAITADWGTRLALKNDTSIVVSRNLHWGSRWFADRNRALWSGFAVVLPSGGNLFFAGDTGMDDGNWPYEAANLGPIGAFRFVPGQMGIGSHIGPLEAADVFDRLGASTGYGMHWGTFHLSYEAWDTPPRLLREVMKCRGQTGFGTVGIGLTVEIASYHKPVSVRRATSPNAVRGPTSTHCVEAKKGGAACRTSHLSGAQVLQP